MSSGSMMSHEGNRQIMADGDQRNYSAAEKAEFESKEAASNFVNNVAHNEFDKNDSDGLDVRRERAEARERQLDNERDAKTIDDPLKPAMDNGNEPSRGAKIDDMLKEEDEQELRKKGPYNGMSHARN